MEFIGTPAQAAKKLREMAELTAELSQNWDNFQDICESMLIQAYEGGRNQGEKDVSKSTES